MAAGWTGVGAGAGAATAAAGAVTVAVGAVVRRAAGTKSRRRCARTSLLSGTPFCACGQSRSSAANWRTVSIVMRPLSRTMPLTASPVKGFNHRPSGRNCRSQPCSASGRRSFSQWTQRMNCSSASGFGSTALLSRNHGRCCRSHARAGSSRPNGAGTMVPVNGSIQFRPSTVRMRHAELVVSCCRRRASV